MPGALEAGRGSADESTQQMNIPGNLGRQNGQTKAPKRLGEGIAGHPEKPFESPAQAQAAEAQLAGRQN